MEFPVRESQNPSSTARRRASVVKAAVFRAPEYKHPTYLTSSPNSIFTVYSPLIPTFPLGTAATAKFVCPDCLFYRNQGSSHDEIWCDQL
ncbi:hypothetical protein BLNAU_2955 [Blattamonas nauphoetae]|uniref:Uncharacterized protein n=1 Tax=Blattamonas nauphoetae TaxID=2049346 RepID=A0ABQ9YDU7_9EUKA|nr:hypothetical protein BLNAU_22996 [Blattamonas nauphoetae]KAK2961899.1 hypothetical protein BLNAU_2955 [Blattamonas nauphoetae]